MFLGKVAFTTLSQGLGNSFDTNQLVKRIITIFLNFWVINAVAQKVELSDNQLNINLIAPSFSYERKLADNESISLAGGVGFTHVTKKDFSGRTTAKLFVVPMVYSTYRTYYKRRRIRKDNLMNNSGNFLGYFGGYRFKAFGSDDFSPVLERGEYSIGTVWGMQRNYRSGIHFTLSIGPGLVGGQGVRAKFNMVGELEFGFTILSR